MKLKTKRIIISIGIAFIIGILINMISSYYIPGYNWGLISVLFLSIGIYYLMDAIKPVAKKEPK